MPGGNSIPSLYPFQINGVEFLLYNNTRLLADDMGLGKTVQVAVAIRELFRQNAVARILIVSPLSLCRNWIAEFQIWCQEIPLVLYHGPDRHGILTGNARAIVAPYDTIVRDLLKPTNDGNKYADIGIDVICLDEAHFIKSSNTLRSRVLSKVMAPRRWALTGTPLENRIEDLGGIFSFLDPNEYSSHSKSINYVALLAHRDRTMLRRLKSEVGVQLPDKTVSYPVVTMTSQQRAVYDQHLKTLKDSLFGRQHGKSTVLTLLAGLTTLSRIAAAASLNESAKIDFIADDIDGAVSNGGKIVIFSSYANTVLPLAAQRLRRYGTVLYTGHMKLAERLEAHRSFTQDPNIRIMCASTKAAGYGITWTVASIVYHLDLWWNPQTLCQAEDRTHRIGQHRPVIAKRLVADASVDCGIQSLHKHKTAIFDYVINGTRTAQQDLEHERDLLALINLRINSRGVVSRQEMH